MASEQDYAEFYDRLGREYPETRHVHGEDPRRYHHVLSEIRPFAALGARMLDVGCNDGVYTIPYCASGGVAHGIDISLSLITKAQTKARGLPATFEVGDIEEYSATIQYDLVLMSEVLEHFRRPERAIENAARAVKPRGHLLLTTPSAGAGVMVLRYLARLFSGRYLVEPYTVVTDGTILGERYGMTGIQYRHDFYYLYALKRWLRRLGFETVKAYTAVHGTYARVPRMLGRLESHVELSRVPLLNLFGETAFLLMRRID